MVPMMVPARITDAGQYVSETAFYRVDDFLCGNSANQAHSNGYNRKYDEGVLVKLGYGQYHTYYGQKYD